jgi:hypothetical protein
MTLKEKLQEEPVYINAFSFKLTKESAEKFEKIADEFAIGFAEWCKQEYELEDTSFHNKWRDVNGEYRETKELLEIYKKENNL